MYAILVDLYMYVYIKMLDALIIVDGHEKAQPSHSVNVKYLYIFML